MIGLCVCLDSLDSSTASTLFFVVCLLGYFSFFSLLRFQIPHLIREKKIIKNHSPPSFHCPLPVLCPAAKGEFSIQKFSLSRPLFFPPLFLSHFSNMSASIRITCQGSHSMLIMCARPPLGYRWQLFFFDNNNNNR